MGFINYLKETRAELRHVSWPSREQAIAYTAVVLALSIIVGLFLGLLDYSFAQGLAKII